MRVVFEQIIALHASETVERAVIFSRHIVEVAVIECRGGGIAFHSGYLVDAGASLVESCKPHIGIAEPEIQAGCIFAIEGIPTNGFIICESLAIFSCVEIGIADVVNSLGGVLPGGETGNVRVECVDGIAAAEMVFAHSCVENRILRFAVVNPAQLVECSGIIACLIERNGPRHCSTITGGEDIAIRRRHAECDDTGKREKYLP